LAGKKLMKVEFAAYATPDAPKQWIRVVANTPSAQWLDRIVGKDAICEVNTPRNSLDLAMAGVGTVLLPTFIGDQRDELERRGSTITELAHDQWIVTHQDDRHLPQVRRTINRLTDLFGRRTKAR
jgi:DNA-binding transcriptional LysR family regulator